MKLNLTSERLWFSVFFIIMLVLGSITIFFVLGFVNLLPVEEEGRASCLIDLNKDLTYEHPLILQGQNFVTPGPKGISLNAGDQLLLVCSGKSNYIQVGSKSQHKTVECVSGNTFKSEGQTYPFKSFSCNDYPESTARRTGKACALNYGKNTETEIGFETPNGFIRIISSCLNEAKKDTLYSIYTLSKSINLQQSRVPRPNGFEEGDFYPNLYPKPSSLYTKKHQVDVFSKFLESNELAKKYIKLNDDYFYLSRGHLTAKADFLYGSQQRATFYYINVAPQWQIFNEENWNTLEMDVRSFAANRKLDLTVYTGTWGNSAFPNVKNKLTNVYLYIAKDNVNHQLTIPEVFWKVLYDPVAKAGIALVGHNNPYETDVAQRPICNNVCAQVNWLNWSANNYTLGYSYCCHVDDLRKKVPYLPEINVKSLLV